ncbi:saccharopine dehydrogenase family protein [Facilibium subflavum]|uniref:saccharopine dehydrogenase family protein n=1 Tax=Facilibium subflavum TaxID=2219058 RepID=UPI000E65D56F|nr:saccharopine dehydrogenase C-terminal domain-containing protein [Facilibium subflavum]
MHNILIFGAGRVGLLTSALLASSGDYQVHLADLEQPKKKLDLVDYQKNVIMTALDVTKTQQVTDYIKINAIDAVVCALPYFLTKKVADIAKSCDIHYFDLTEDVETTRYVERIAKDSNKIFAPQCGLAPGFISVVTNDLIQQFDQVETAKMRVGALPVNISNPLQYALTWSTAGLINEYVKPCLAIENHKVATLKPLEDLETIKIDGLTYEAFNTSGGIGSLKDTYQGKVRNINYKSVRYPGHCEKLRFLINDLKLKDKQELLCEIFENALPHVDDDVVLVYVSTEGYINGEFSEKHFAKKFHSLYAFGRNWTALQLTTACGLCVTIDLALKENKFKPGFVKQEYISLQQMMDNRFGHYYRYNFLQGLTDPKQNTIEQNDDISVEFL